jgi:hypothetical protein
MVKKGQNNTDSGETEKYSEYVIFSDDFTFCLISLWAQNVRRPCAINCSKKRLVLVNIKHSAGLWCGCYFCGKEGRGSLYILSPSATMTIKVMEEKLFPWMERLRATKLL